MVISYSIWKYILGLGALLAVVGIGRILIADSESARSSGIFLIAVAVPLVASGLLLAAIANSRKS